MKNPKINIYLRRLDGRIKRVRPFSASGYGAKGMAVKYRLNGKVYTFHVARDWKWEVCDGRPSIGLREGSQAPCAVFGLDQKDIPGEEWNILLRNHLVAEETDEISSGMKLPTWLLIVVLVVMIGGIAFIATQCMGGDEVVPSNNGQNIEDVIN